MVAAGARAATGDLTFAQCFDDDDTNLEGARCPGAPGLDAVSSVAVSADGMSLYAASFNNDAIVRFNRNATTGALTFAECIEGGALEGAICPDVLAVDGADAVAVSGDGKSVYLASASADAIVRFNRNTTTGDISFAQCFQDKTDSPFDAADCADASALNFATSVAVSADGRSLYAAAGTDDAVVRFNRTTTGALTFAECFDDEDTNLEGATCPGAPGLDGPTSVAVSGEGKSFYAAAGTDDAIVRFNRTTSGDISFAECFDDEDTNLEGASCTGTPGLRGATSVEASGDGKSLYASSSFDSAVVRFNRTTTGALTFAECFDDEDTNAEGATCLGAPGIAGANSVAVSADGRSLYAASLFDDALASFNRTTSGDISFSECFDDEDANLEGPKCQAAPALDTLASVAVSADGRSLYAASHDDDAVVRFNREPLGSGGGGGGGGGGGTPPPGGTPPNDFSFGKVKKNKRKGTAKLTVKVPGAGELDLAKTKKVKADDESAEDAGKEKLSIKPKGKAKKKLNTKGKAKVKAEVTYTPAGGSPNTEDKEIKLVKR